MPGAHQVIGRCLAGGVRGVGLISRLLGEKAVLAQAAVHLIGGDVVEAELGLALSVQTAPVFARRLQQGISANDVGLDKVGRAGDGAIHMRFRGQVHHGRRLMLAEHPSDFGRITDVHLFKAITRIIRHRSERLQIARVGQLVEIDHAAIGIVDELTNDGGADEARAAGDEDSFIS